MKRYEDIHVDDGMRHDGLLQSREERHQERVKQAFRKRIADLEAEKKIWLEEDTKAETLLDELDAAALELTGPWPAGTCCWEAISELPDEYRKLQARITELEARTTELEAENAQLRTAAT